jgi:hypothetical protein
LTHNSIILSTTTGFQGFDDLPFMALAWAGKRYSHTPLQRLFSIALLIRVANERRSGNGS